MAKARARDLPPPPRAIEVEKALLSAIILDPDVLPEVSAIVSKDSFYYKPHCVIFEIMLELYSEEGKFDYISLTEKLDSAGLLPEVGGVSYIAEVAGSASTSAMAVYHAKIVAEKAKRRKLITCAHQAIRDGYDESKDIDQILSEVEGYLLSLRIEGKTAEWYDTSSVMMDLLEEIEDGRTQGLPTGIKDLDDLTGGLYEGDFILLGGVPSSGKTALALQIALHVARRGCPVAFFSMEMPRKDLIRRILAQETSVNLARIRHNRLKPEEMNAILEMAPEIAKVPLWIDDTTGLSAMDVRARTIALLREKEVKLIAIDYLQLMQWPEKAQSREEAITAISKSLKAIARELNIPVMAISRLSKRAELRATNNLGEDIRPQIGDLRESGALEFDADLILFTHRPALFEHSHFSDKPESCEIIVAKQRNGPVGIVDVRWLPSVAKFTGTTEGGISTGVL